MFHVPARSLVAIGAAGLASAALAGGVAFASGQNGHSATTSTACPAPPITAASGPGSPSGATRSPRIVPLEQGSAKLDSQAAKAVAGAPGSGSGVDLHVTGSRALRCALR
jgi:hypothetical protein